MPSRRRAEIILRGGNVLTLVAGLPRTEAVAAAGETILAAGADTDVAALRGSTTRVIDCRGKTVVPGFNDAHCHFFALVRRLLSLDCGPAAAGSMAKIQAIIRERAATATPGTWIIATGYDESRLAEKRHPTRHDLDQATTVHPVRLLHRTGRASVLNSPALSLAGVSAASEDPPGGLIDRDHSGEPTGLLFQMDRYLEGALPPLNEQELLEGVRLADRLNISRGITSLQDASASNDLSQWRTFSRLRERGRVRSRITVMPGFDALAGLRQGGVPFRAGGPYLRLGGVKVVVDRTTGLQNPPQQELDRQVLQARRWGCQVGMHCVEEEDIAAAATALERSRMRGAPHLRPRIEHCSVCPTHLVKRLRALGAVVVSQPPFLYFSGARYLTEVPPDRRRWLYRFRTLQRAGIPVAASSDAPVADNNPLLGIYAAVTRRTLEGETVLPRERVTALQALGMYTRQAAYAAFDEKEKGTISPGKLADLVVLSADPTGVPTEEIKDIHVEMTIIGGRVVFEG